MKTYNIRIGDTLHICDDPGLDVIRPLAIKALKRGVEVKWFNGVIQWIHHEVVFDASKSGSSVYTWNEDGEKVLHNIVLYSEFDNKMYSEKIGETYRKDW